jgi:hypothetical protein
MTERGGLWQRHLRNGHNYSIVMTGANETQRFAILFCARKQNGENTRLIGLTMSPQSVKIAETV